jgi:very-short-patch-repair endonuclease
VQSGQLHRPRRGVYQLPGKPGARQIAGELRGVVSHLSAAALLRLDTVSEPEALHITVPHGMSRAPRDGVVLHRSRHLDPDDLIERCTSPLRTVVDCARTLPFVEALAIADSTLKLGLVMRDGLLDAATALARAPARSSAVTVAHWADGRAANAFESVLRGRLIEAGITTFVPQYAITAGPLSLHVDLADPLAGVVLEADSFEFHGSRADFRRDCERYDELVAAGWTVLRLPWELVLHDHARLLRLVRAAMTGERPGSSERTVPT